MEIVLEVDSIVPTCMVIGDPHFKQNEFYLQRVEEMGKQFVALCKERKPDFIVVLGDTLHEHRKIDMVAQCKAVRFLRELKKISPLFLLIGNHDRMNNSDFLSEYSPFEALKDWDNTYVIDKPLTLQLVSRCRVDNKPEINILSYYFVPYVSPQKYMEALSIHNIDPEKYHMGFCHQEFKGVKMGSMISEEGDEWNYDKPKVCGHVHDQQMILNKNGKPYINYIGTPIGHSHGEHGRKTVSLFSFHISQQNQNKETYNQNKERETYWCTSGEYNVYEEKIELDVEKLKTVYIHANDFINYEFTSTIDPRHFRFVINDGTDAEIRLAKKSDKFSELENLGCKIHFPVIKPEIETKIEYQNQFETKTFEQRVVGKLPPNLIPLYREIVH